MIIVLISFAVIIVFFLGGFMINLDFQNYDFSYNIDRFLQSKTINEQNYNLFSYYKNYFNSGTNDNDYTCYSGSAYEDNNCLFKGMYGFLPPKKTLDLGIFQNLSGTEITLNLTGDLTNGVIVAIKNINGGNILRYNLNTTGNVIPVNLSGDYSIKLTNNALSWNQYFMYLTGADGFDFALSSVGGVTGISRGFFGNIGGIKTSTYSNLTTSTLELKSCAEAKTLGFGSGTYLIKDNIFTGGKVGYCELQNSQTIEGINDSYTKLFLRFENNATDSSSNNYTITNNGITFSNSIYKLGSYSSYFNGSSYLSVVDNSNWDLGNSDFTIDWREYNDTTPTAASIYARTDNRYPGILIQLNSGNKSVHFGSNGSSFDIGALSFGVIAPQTWYHHAIVRNGNIFTAYTNGIQTDTFTSSASIFSTSGSPLIGRGQGGYYFRGYLENFRISKGIARRTSNFSLVQNGNTYFRPYDMTSTSLTNTKLLLQSETTSGSTTFADSSSSAKTITNNGNVVNTATQAKFGTSSIYFSGSNYLSVPTSTDFNFGTGDFTIDFWINPSITHTDNDIIDFGTNLNTDPRIMFWTNNNLYYFLNGDTNCTVSDTSGTTNNQWTHYAISRSGTNIYIFKNGLLSQKKTSCSKDLSYSAPLVIGRRSDGGTYFKGYLEELRITKGQALRTSDFTPPIAPYRY